MTLVPAGRLARSYDGIPRATPGPRSTSDERARVSNEARRVDGRDEHAAVVGTPQAGKALRRDEAAAGAAEADGIGASGEPGLPAVEHQVPGVRPGGDPPGERVLAEDARGDQRGGDERERLEAINPR